MFVRGVARQDPMNGMAAYAQDVDRQGMSGIIVYVGNVEQPDMNGMAAHVLDAGK